MKLIYLTREGFEELLWCWNHRGEVGPITLDPQKRDQRTPIATQRPYAALSWQKFSLLLSTTLGWHSGNLQSSLAPGCVKFRLEDVRRHSPTHQRVNSLLEHYRPGVYSRTIVDTVLLVCCTLYTLCILALHGGVYSVLRPAEVELTCMQAGSTYAIRNRTYCVWLDVSLNSWRGMPRD